MKKLVLLLAGATLSLAATAQTNSSTSESLMAQSSVLTSVLTVGGPIVLLTAITLAAEDNDTPSGPATTPSSTATAR